MFEENQKPAPAFKGLCVQFVKGDGRTRKVHAFCPSVIFARQKSRSKSQSRTLERCLALCKSSQYKAWERGTHKRCRLLFPDSFLCFMWGSPLATKTLPDRCLTFRYQVQQGTPPGSNAMGSICSFVHCCDVRMEGISG